MTSRRQIKSTEPLPALRSDSGPIGAQIEDALGLGAGDNAVEIWPETEKILNGRGLEIRKHIARGGYGIVYRAKETMGGPRAVKVVIDPSSKTAVAAFNREWRVLASRDLPGVADNQPRVAPQFHFGEETTGAQHFLVLEWIEGSNLQDYINARPSLAMAQREALCERIFVAYEALHRANLLHRDVSLRNIMIQNGKVRVIDFGSACRKDAGYASQNSLSQVPITRAFASDNLAAGETRGTVADEVHAIAKCCFFVLTGQRSDQIPADQWSSTLKQKGVDRDIAAKLILPRMQQPPDHAFA